MKLTTKKYLTLKDYFLSREKNQNPEDRFFSTEIKCLKLRMDFFPLEKNLLTEGMISFPYQNFQRLGREDFLPKTGRFSSNKRRASFSLSSQMRPISRQSMGN